MKSYVQHELFGAPAPICSEQPQARLDNFGAEALSDTELIALLREHDQNANVRWALSHYRSAVRYLDAKPKEIEATGGTNWQKYLPPRFQKIIFFPELWSEAELENWGKTSS